MNANKTMYAIGDLKYAPSSRLAIVQTLRIVRPLHAGEVGEHFLERRLAAIELEEAPAVVHRGAEDRPAEVGLAVAHDEKLRGPRLAGLDGHVPDPGEGGELVLGVRAVTVEEHAVAAGVLARHEVVRLAVGDDLAVVDDDHAPARRLHLGQDVRGQDDRLFLAELL